MKDGNYDPGDKYYNQISDVNLADSNNIDYINNHKFLIKSSNELFVRDSKNDKPNDYLDSSINTGRNYYLESSSTGSANVDTPSLIRDDETPLKNIKIKGAKQKVEQDDRDEQGTKIYGKSPRFDNESFGAFNTKNDNIFHDFDTLDGRNDNFFNNQTIPGNQFYGSEDDVLFGSSPTPGVVFNTLDGFEARNNEERKIGAAGQIKRPLSQDEDVSSKNGRSIDDLQQIEGPEVTPGDVGRMLNLGNALDGPRLAQPNKYLSLVTLHLPVILRLSVNCPFQNVRTKCAEILQMVKVRF